MPEATPRTDVALFAEQILHRPLWPHQLEAARSEAFITSIAAARRTGKTTLIETMASWTCFREPNVKAVILSATQDSARQVTEHIGETLANLDETRGSVVDDFATRIRLTNGSQIISLPASQRQIRGYGRDVKLLVIDEAGFVAEELWRAAHYVALDERGKGSRIFLTGTPWGGPELFFRKAYQSGLDGDQDHASHHWTHEANPDLDHDYLERRRQRVSPAEYAAEVLGEWSDAAGSLFSQELLDRQTADVELPDLLDLRGPAQGIVGVDYGVSFDASAACAIFRLPIPREKGNVERWLPRFIAIPHVWPVKTPLSEVVADVASAGGVFSHVATETNGVGAMPSQELRARLAEQRREEMDRSRRPIPPRMIYEIATTSQKKTAGYGAILGLLERGQLILPRHPELLRQLAGLRFEQGERGFTSIGAEDSAVHDDVSDGLYLASLPVQGRRMVRSALATFANPERAKPDAAYATDEPLIRTGGGLKIPQRPALQSVVGLEITYPGRHEQALGRAYEISKGGAR